MTAPLGIVPQPMDLDQCGICGGARPEFSLMVCRPKRNPAESPYVVFRLCSTCATTRGGEVLRDAVGDLRALDVTARGGVS